MINTIREISPRRFNMAFRLRRGTDAERQTVVFAQGELVYVTDTQEVYAGDGSTLGGIRITGSVEGSPASLTQNLNLANYQIVGTGTINMAGSVTATTFVGDGSQLTGISGSGTGITEGQTYDINILGDIVSGDSSLAYDSATGIFTGDFSGDGSLLTGITLDQLQDVTAIGPNANDVLAYVGGSWTSIDVASIYAGGSGTGILEGQTYDINISGSLIASDSGVAWDPFTETFAGNFSGPLNGNVTGNVTGNVVGDLTGNMVGELTGGVFGYLVGDVTGSVFGTDSTVLLNATTRRLVGDVSGNVTGDLTGNVTGSLTGEAFGYFQGQLTGDLYSQTSSLAFDGATGTFYGSALVGQANDFVISGTAAAAENTVTIKGAQARGSLLLLNEDTSQDYDGQNITLGYVGFGKNDINGLEVNSQIIGKQDRLLIGVDSTGAYADASKYYTFRNGGLHIGGADPLAKLHITDGSIILQDSRAIGAISNPQDGELFWDSANKKLNVYDGDILDWRAFPSVRTDLFDGAGTWGSLLVMVPIDQGEIDGIGNDSTVVTGTLLYNTDKDCFEFNQAGSYTNIPNAGDHTGQLSQWNQSTGKWEVSSWETPNTGQFLYWDGTHWSPTNAPAGGGGGGGSAFTNIGVAADDSAIRLINEGETISILGGAGISTTSDAEGTITITASISFASLTGTPTTIAGYGITDAFDGAWGSLTGTPTTLAGYGITDAATSAQGTLADSALQAGDAFDVQGSVFADDSTLLVDAVNGLVTGPMENPTITGTIDSSDSSAITVVPAVVMNSDLTVENDLRVTNRVIADTLQVTTLTYTNLETVGSGTPEIESDGAIALTAGTRVEITQSPIKMASFTTSERDALSSQNGDMIYNSTTNKFQGYANGVWVDLH